MIKHIVMWNLRGDTPDAKAASADLVREKFEGLKGKIDGLIEIEVGVNVSDVGYACDVVLYSVFETAEALAEYADHPEHLKVREALADLRIARHQVDYATGTSSATRPRP